VEQGVQTNAIAIPQQAVQRDTSGQAQVYVVGADGTVELRNVTAGRVIADRWVIEAGLNAGDRVVVEGFQKIRPGAQVSVEPWQPGRTAGETGAGSASSERAG